MEVRIPQTVVNDVEQKCWTYKIRSQNAIKAAEKRLRDKLYKTAGYDFSKATMIVVE